jgi:hypothetical protein
MSPGHVPRATNVHFWKKRAQCVRLLRGSLCNVVLTIVSEAVTVMVGRVEFSAAPYAD